MGSILKWLAKKREEAQRRSDEFRQRFNQLRTELQNEINPLPLTEAKQRAEVLLSDPTKFECVLASQSMDPRLEPLAPELRAFFERYKRVLKLPWSLELDRVMIEPSLAGHGLIQIGLTGYEHEQLAVLPGEETVYYVAEDGPEEEALSDRFTTVYHCVLYFDREQTLLFSRP